MANVVVAVLSGGRSRRMGTDKALVTLEGRSLASWVQRATGSHNCLFVGGDVPDVRTIEDAPGQGPLAGLAAALSVGADAVLLVAVDQPWLRAGTLQALIDRYRDRPVVPLDHGIRQVTCAVYPASLAPTAARLAADGRALQALLDDIDVDEVAADEWQGWGEDGRSWFGVNTAADVDNGLAHFGPPGVGR